MFLFFVVVVSCLSIAVDVYVVVLVNVPTTAAAVVVVAVLADVVSDAVYCFFNEIVLFLASFIHKRKCFYLT